VLPLLEYQTQLSGWLLSPDGESTPNLDPGIARSHSALRVHQNTIFQALVAALRTTFPTVAQLIGERAFELIARRYARQFPPETAVLYEYGRYFPEHLRLEVPEYACLGDIARFDLLIDRTGRESPALLRNRIAVTSATSLRLTKSLRCGRFEYAVDSIREAVETGRTDIGKELTECSRSNLAIWRTSAGVSVRSLSEPALLFLEVLILGRGADEAIVRAVEGCSVDQALEAIQRDVFASSLCRVITPSTPEITP
jgi:hypothetical protein